LLTDYGQAFLSHDMLKWGVGRVEKAANFMPTQQMCEAVDGAGDDTTAKQ
jgi:hypothetical protein